MAVVVDSVEMHPQTLQVEQDEAVLAIMCLGEAEEQKMGLMLELLVYFLGRGSHRLRLVSWMYVALMDIVSLIPLSVTETQVHY